MGYGICEEPRPNEVNQPEICAKKGYFQYSFVKQATIFSNANRFEFDQAANRDLIIHLAKHPSVRKIFIEPHLKTRLGLQKYNKVRFHGCGAVRHDDHIHIQL